MKTANLYKLPVDQRLITETVVDNQSHTGVYKGSIDFAVPLGTIVSAAHAGTVIRVHDDSQKYGTDPKFGPEVNYITIQHSNKELSEYLHLDYGSAKVAVGQTVKTGQEIATTGLSGWLYAPHLHFMVYKYTADSPHFQCLEVQFT